MKEEKPHEQIAIYRIPVDEYKMLVISVEKFDNPTDYKIYLQGIYSNKNKNITFFTFALRPNVNSQNHRQTSIEIAAIEAAEKTYKFFKTHHLLQYFVKGININNNEISFDLLDELRKCLQFDMHTHLSPIWIDNIELVDR